VSGKIGGNGQNGGLELETGTLRHLLGIRFGSSFVWFGCNHAILASIELKQYFSFPFPLCRLCYFPRDAPKNTIYISTFVGCRLLGEFTIYRVPFAPVSGNPLFLFLVFYLLYLSTVECTRGSLQKTGQTTNKAKIRSNEKEKFIKCENKAGLQYFSWLSLALPGFFPSTSSRNRNTRRKRMNLGQEKMCTLRSPIAAIQ